MCIRDSHLRAAKSEDLFGADVPMVSLLGSLVLTVVVCLAGLDLYDTTTYLLVLRAEMCIRDRSLCGNLWKVASLGAFCSLSPAVFFL